MITNGPSGSNFLARFDFRRCYAKEPNKWKCTLLRRELL